MRTMHWAMGTYIEDGPCRSSDAPYAPYAFDNAAMNGVSGKMIWQAQAKDKCSSFQTISGKSEVH
jgi:hypothetical protein